MADIVREITGIAPFVMIILVVWFGIQKSMNQNRMRAEFQKEILAKFTSAQELNEFLATDAGRRLTQESSESKWGYKGRIITLAVAGMIVLGAGIGFHFGGDDREAAALFSAVGVALLA